MTDSSAEPAVQNTPQGGGSARSADQRAEPGAPPPAANQPKTEEIPNSTGAAGADTVGSGDPQGPRPTGASGGTTEAGDGATARGVGEEPPTAATSGIADVAAPEPAVVPTKPDGEVDTRL